MKLKPKSNGSSTAPSLPDFHAFASFTARVWASSAVPSANTFAITLTSPPSPNHRKTKADKAQLRSNFASEQRRRIHLQTNQASEQPENQDERTTPCPLNTHASPSSDAAMSEPPAPTPSCRTILLARSFSSATPKTTSTAKPWISSKPSLLARL